MKNIWNALWRIPVVVILFPFALFFAPLILAAFVVLDIRDGNTGSWGGAIVLTIGILFQAMNIGVLIGAILYN